jgi:hypothetical protein
VREASQRREPYHSELECPSCKGVCVATWMENENLVYGRSGLGRKLVALSQGFRQAEDSNAVFCLACGIAILRWA